MKPFFKKLIWNLLTFGAYGAICFMLELPMTSIVFSLMEHDDPNMVTVATMTVGLFLTLYAVYLKRLRNDQERRQYLTDIRRQYGTTKIDLSRIFHSRTYRHEVLSFAAIVTVLAVRFVLRIALQERLALGERFLLIGVVVAFSLVLCVVYALVNLLILNRIHRAWVDALIVPDESDEEFELRRKKAAMIRNYAFQFGFSLSFWVLYLLNSYAVTFAIVVTPALFIYSQVQGIMGITHFRNIDQPYRTYVILQILSLGLYVFSLVFGSFAPKI